MVGRAVLIGVRAPPTPARPVWRRARISHFARTAYPLTQLPFGFQIIVEETDLVLKNTRYRIMSRTGTLHKHCTSLFRHLQPGESTQVGAILDVNVGGAAAAAAVGVLGSLRHGGHCRWVVSLAVGATLPVGHRSTSESACGQRVCSSRVPAPRAPPHPGPARSRAAGRLELADRVTTPAHPPSQPFIDTPGLTRSYLFCLKNWRNPLVLIVCGCDARALATNGHAPMLQPLPGRFLSVPGNVRDTQMPPNC